MQPIVHGLEQTFGDDIDFVLLDIDDPATQEAQRRYGFRGTPHFLLVDAEGEVVTEWFGYNSANVFEEAFAALLGAG